MKQLLLEMVQIPVPNIFSFDENYIFLMFIVYLSFFSFCFYPSTDLVLPSIVLGGEHSVATMSSLVVVVVNKNNSMKSVGHPPALEISFG